MNPHMSSKLKRNVNSSDNTRRWRSGRNSSIHNLMSASLLFNKRGKPTLRSGQAPRSPCTTPNPKWQRAAPATITGSHVDQVARTAINKVGTRVVDTTRITQVVEAKVAGATVVGPTHRRAVAPLMLEAGCLEQVGPEAAAAVVRVMERQTTRRVVHMEVRVVGGPNMGGNGNQQYNNWQ